MTGKLTGLEFKKEWYTEVSSVQDGVATSLLIKKLLFQGKSKYQDILIFDSYVFGRVLILDDVIQLSEKDEFAYQEMLSFLPLTCHPNPKNVLIVGGGDGGVVREVLKYPLVETITLCELDEQVIKLAKEYLPFMSSGFESPKLTVYLGDGAKFMKEHKAQFDVIITDSPDPVGPAICLFQQPYYESLKESLKPGGVICSQGVDFWFSPEIIEELVTTAKKIFPVVDYAISYVGSYTGGHLGYMLCSTSQITNFRKPIQKFSPQQLKEMKLRYYTPDVHRASFALPVFLAEILKLKWELS